MKKLRAVTEFQRDDSGKMHTIVEVIRFSAPGVLHSVKEYRDSRAHIIMAVARYTLPCIWANRGTVTFYDQGALSFITPLRTPLGEGVHQG